MAINEIPSGETQNFEQSPAGDPVEGQQFTPQDLNEFKDINLDEGVTVDVSEPKSEGIPLTSDGGNNQLFSQELSVVTGGGDVNLNDESPNPLNVMGYDFTGTAGIGPVVAGGTEVASRLPNDGASDIEGGNITASQNTIKTLLGGSPDGVADDFANLDLSQGEKIDVALPKGDLPTDGKFSLSDFSLPFAPEGNADVPPSAMGSKGTDLKGTETEKAAVNFPGLGMFGLEEVNDGKTIKDKVTVGGNIDGTAISASGMFSDENLKDGTVVVGDEQNNASISATSKDVTLGFKGEIPFNDGGKISVDVKDKIPTDGTRLPATTASIGIQETDGDLTVGGKIDNNGNYGFSADLKNVFGGTVNASLTAKSDGNNETKIEFKTNPEPSNFTFDPKTQIDQAIDQLKTTKFIDNNSGSVNVDAFSKPENYNFTPGGITPKVDPALTQQQQNKLSYDANPNQFIQNLLFGDGTNATNFQPNFGLGGGTMPPDFGSSNLNFSPVIFDPGAMAFSNFA
jgi:hypothetical protein